MGAAASAGVAPWSARARDRGWCGRGDGGERSEREHGQRNPVERRSAGRLDRLTGDGDRVRRYLGRRAGHGHGQHRAWRSGRDDHLRDGLLGQYGESGRRCGTILDCEKTFFVGLNAAAVADGSTDEVAVVKFDSSSSIALGLTDPTSAAVNTAINSGGPGRWHDLCRRSFRGADASERHDERHQDRGLRLGRPLQRGRERLGPRRRSGHSRCDRALDRDRRW